MHAGFLHIKISVLLSTKATNPAASTPDATEILEAQDIFQHTGWHWDGRPGGRAAGETGAADGVSHQQLSSQLRPAAALQVPVWAPLLPRVSELDMQQTQEGV